MTKKCIFLGYITLCFFSITYGQDSQQQLISTAGDIYKTDNMTLSWSLGEIAGETLSNVDLFLAQGFQQGNGLITHVKQEALMEAEIKLYPNPASTSVTIEFPPAENESMGNSYQMQIYDVNSKLHDTKMIHQVQTSLALQHYRSGIYFIKILDLNLLSKQTFVLQVINN